MFKRISNISKFKFNSNIINKNIIYNYNHNINNNLHNNINTKNIIIRNFTSSNLLLSSQNESFAFSEEIEKMLSRNPREALDLIEKGCIAGQLQITESQLKTYFKIAMRYNLIDKINVSPVVQSYIGSNNKRAQNSLTSMFSAFSGGSEKFPLHVNVLKPTFFQSLRDSALKLVTLFFSLVIFLSILDDKNVTGSLTGRVTGTATHRAENSDKRFDDVVGVDEAKDELKEIVEYLKEPKKFTRLGGKLPKGVLLTGPPGTGKTLLAKAIAGEAGVRFLYSSGSEFEEMFVGVGAKRVRELFQQANDESPCIIFIDEIDAIGGIRQLKDQGAMKMTLNQLLVEMDGFKENSGVIVIAATNFPESLDPALTRPGRIDKHVTVNLPDVGGRKAILEHYGKKVPLSNDVDFDQLARGTPGFSGAELANLVNEAAIRSAVKNLSKIDMASLEYAKDKIMMGSERQSAVISKETMKVTAYHEAGHALISLLTNGADPIHKATIMPRGRALGMVMQLPDGDQTSYSRKQMLAKLDICMGGRIAEEMIFGEDNVTSGATGDFQQATKLAHAMITKWGFSTKLGVQYLDDKEKLSGETQNIVDTEVRKLLDDSYIRAKALLQSHQKELKLIADALMEHETLSGAEIADIYYGRPLNLRVRTQKASRELTPMPETKKKSKLTAGVGIPNSNTSVSHTPNTSTSTISSPTSSSTSTTKTSSPSTNSSTSNTPTAPITSEKTTISKQQNQQQNQIEKNGNENKTPIRGPPVTPK